MGSALKRQRNAHAAANAQGRQTLLGITALHFVQQGHQDAAARRANGVANRDGTAVDVDLGGINGQLFVHCAGLCRKRFVQLEQVHIGGVPASALQSLAGSRHGAHAHRGGVQAAGAKGRNARQGLEAQRCGLLGAHHYHGGGAVIDARGIAGRYAAGLVKRGAQASQGFGTGLAVEVLVHVEACHG